MTDFDYSGYGLFESLASDQQEERASKRKALVTAQSRVESNLGRFLKAAKSGPEFDERYALVQQEFVATVREVADEFGVQSDTIGNTIFSHYRTAAYKVANGDEKEENEKAEEAEAEKAAEDDGDDDDDGSSDKPEADDFDDDDPDTWHAESSVKTAGKCEKCAGDCDCGPGCDCSGCSCCGGKQGGFLARTADGGDQGNCSECGEDGWLKGGVCGPCRGKKLQQGDRDKIEDEYANKVNASTRSAGMGLNELQTPENMQNAQNAMAGPAPVAPAAPPVLPPNLQTPDATAGVSGVAGPPQQPQSPGVQQLQQMMQQGMGNTASLRWAAKVDEGDTYDSDTEDLPTNTGKGHGDGNTDLDGPSPKIDKGDARKPGDQGWSTGEIDVPSKKHPTERIDPTVALPRENVKNSVKDDVKGIGESVTEVQELPTSTNYDDAGFAGPNQEQAPHTDTWGNDGQTEPVQSEALTANMRWAALVPKIAAWACPTCGTENQGPICSKCHQSQPAGAPVSGDRDEENNVPGRTASGAFMNEGEQYQQEMADEGRHIPQGWGGDEGQGDPQYEDHYEPHPRDLRVQEGLTNALQSGAANLEQQIKVLEDHGFGRGEAYEILTKEGPEGYGRARQEQRGFFEHRPPIKDPLEGFTPQDYGPPPF